MSMARFSSVGIAIRYVLMDDVIFAHNGPYAWVPV